MNPTDWLSESWAPASWRQYLLMLSVVAIVYVLAARLGTSLSFTPAQITTVWPPSGISMAILLKYGYRFWPGVFIGAVASYVLFSPTQPLYAGFLIATGTTLTVVTATYLLHNWSGFRQISTTVRDCVVLIAASAISSVFSATIGTLALATDREILWQSFGSIWLVWWSGDVMGFLLFAPFLLVLLSPRSYQVLKGRLTEIILLIVSVSGMSLLIFSVGSSNVQALPLPYMLFPFISWAALRFTRLGVVISALLITGIAGVATYLGRGPFAGGSEEAALVELQVYIFILVVTGLIMAAAIIERAEAAEALQRQAKRMESLEGELREANRRITDILASLLKDESNRRGPR